MVYRILAFVWAVWELNAFFAELLGFMGYDATHIKLRNHMEQKSSLIQLQNRLDMSFKKKSMMVNVLVVLWNYK